MKKFLIVLLVIAIVLALAAAAVAGYIWYKNNHVFVEGDAYPLDSQFIDLREQDISISYFDQLHALLPECEILWNVPFQGGRLPSNTGEITISALSHEEEGMLSYFPELETIRADSCNDYALLSRLSEVYTVSYQVSLGGTSYAPDTAALELNADDYTYEALLENLKYLPQVTTVKLRMPQLTTEQMEELEAAYEAVAFTCTVELLGQEYDTDTTELDLSALGSADVAAVCEKLAMLPGLEAVELMGENGSQLSKEDVKALQTAAPNASFHYTFEFYGETISTTDEEVHITNKKIGDEGLPEVRAALDIMENCSRFVLESCHISNEEMAKLREEYRDKTNIVWRVYFGEGGSCLTDREVIKAVYGLTDGNSKDLIYCEGARFCDFGHNEILNNCDFVAGMPNLEAIILSGSPIKSLEAFRNCKKLKFLELAFCGYITDISPLAECESLEMLNISATKVEDITPAMELPLTLFSAKNLKLTDEMKNDFREKHPECWTSFQREGDSVQPYGQGWRYDENNQYLPYYKMLRDKDHFYYDGPIMNTTRW